MSKLPSPDDILATTKVAQIGALIKDNQLLTAAILFILWQVGVLAQIHQTALGGVC